MATAQEPTHPPRRPWAAQVLPPAESTPGGWRGGGLGGISLGPPDPTSPGRCRSRGTAPSQACSPSGIPRHCMPEAVRNVAVVSRLLCLGRSPPREALLPEHEKSLWVVFTPPEVTPILGSHT